MSWDDLPAGRYLMLLYRAGAGRMRKESGDVSVMATIIIAAGLALIAVAVVAAIKLKVNGFLTQIP